MDGLFLECHPDPKNAKSDAATMLGLEEVEPLLTQCKQIAELRERVVIRSTGDADPRISFVSRRHGLKARDDSNGERFNALPISTTHGRARMVDVGHKPITAREAIAEGFIMLRPETLRAIAEERVPKGEVLNTARIAGIMAAKRCGELIPLCHPLPIESVEVHFDIPELEPDRTEPVRLHIKRHRPDHREDGRRNGSAHRRLRRGADRLRHVQGDRQARW